MRRERALEPPSAAVILALVLLLAQSSAGRAALARVELAGPCAGIAGRIEGAGSFELELEPPLGDGERRTFELAVPLPASPLTPEVDARRLREALARAGAARLVGVAVAADLSAVPPELLARPRPELAARGARLPWSALFVLGAALALQLGNRRRTAVATAAALLAAVAVVLLVRGLGPRELSAARLLEARLDAAPGEPWLAVESRHGELRLAELAGARIDVSPAFGELRCRTRAVEPRFALDAAAATIARLRAVDPGARRLTRAVNALASFEAAWLREADGTWRALGPWKLGDPVPEGRAGEPPGWLVPALPMGTSIFLGRLEDGQLADAFERGPGPPIWLRGLGL